MAIVSGATDLDEITDDCPSATVTFHIGDPDYYGQHRRMDMSDTGIGSPSAARCLPLLP